MTTDGARPPRVYISILNWNNAPACIRSVRRSLSPTDVIVVLDNGSTDSSVETLKTVVGIELITAEQSLGVAGGHNRVLSYAVAQHFEYVWLLNNDALVQGDCLQRLIQYAQGHPDCALTSPVILDNLPPHACQHTLSVLNATGTGVEEIQDLYATREKQVIQAQRVIVWGTALLVRVSAIGRLGYLDEKLFAYSEDTDNSLRSLRERFQNAVVFDAVVRHEHPPRPRRPHYYYTQRDSSPMWRKYTNPLKFLKLLRWNLRLAHGQLAVMAGNPEAVAAMKLGIWHGWFNRGGGFNREQRLGLPARWLVGLALAIS